LNQGKEQDRKKIESKEKRAEEMKGIKILIGRDPPENFSTKHFD
jgi:hypothetical protein